MLERITITGFSDEIDPDLNKQMKVIKQLGISHIEIRGVDGKNLTKYTLEEVKRIKRRMEDGNISVSSIGSPIGKISIREDFENHMELFKHTVEIAHIMKTDKIRVFSFFIPQEEDPEQFEEKVMEQTGRMVDYAAEQNILLLHENEKDIYGDMADRCLKLMKHFYGSHYQCIFDFANFVQCRQDTLAAYEMLKPYISYVHIKDAVWEDGKVVPAGMGDGHVEEILRDLDKRGYGGYLSLEPHLSEFKGFSELETGKMMERELTGEEAYTIAFRALEKLLSK